MSLGISNANELDQQESLKHLANWLRYHPDFCGLPILKKQEVLDLDDVEQGFTDAFKLKPGDS